MNGFTHLVALAAPSTRYTGLIAATPLRAMRDADTRSSYSAGVAITGGEPSATGD